MITPNEIYKNKIAYESFHILFNLYVCCSTYKSFLKLLTFKNIINIVPNVNNIHYHVASFHIAHIFTDYKNMSIIDYVHHFTTIFMIFMQTVVRVEPQGEAVTFIICGLPGAIDYLFYILGKKKIISKLVQKRFSTHINLFLRYPLTLLYFYSVVYYSKDNSDYLNNIIAYVPPPLLLFNAYYFARESCISYGKFLV